ncbi:MAG: MaoC family dehydratase N-terminal domain-containing protein [Myxococcales bacterium]
MDESQDLSPWIGNTEVRKDAVRASQVAAWNATLDRDEPFPAEREPVPPGFHWTLFADVARHSELGPDGHPRRGGFLPPVTLPRRMWAGSEVRFGVPLRVGDDVEQTSVVERIEEKQGRAGRLCFVTVHRTTRCPRGIAVDEDQHLVYRDAQNRPAFGGPIKPADPGAWRRTILPDDVLLFRFSALTFNGHRIHYDHRYATEQEGYPGLVVHGPLIATLLLDLLRRRLPEASPSAFTFKALRPTFDISPFDLDGEPDPAGGPVRLWSTDNNGEVAVEAEAVLK